MIRRIADRLRFLLAQRLSAAPHPPGVQASGRLDQILLAGCRKLDVGELIRTRDQGYEVGGVLPALMTAIDTALTERGIEICPCGASPNRPHTRTCKEP